MNKSIFVILAALVGLVQLTVPALAEEAATETAVFYVH